ncbi:hypothetical protein A2U01_0045179, partial [Trifolium medium]|nr:hypothetical protein [Trifolium medium]
MSQTSDSSQIKNKSTETPSNITKTRPKSKKETSYVVLDAKPISIVPSTESKKKSTRFKYAVKKGKPTKVSESSPFVSIKSVGSKSKKKKPQSSVQRGLSMHDLYVSEDPFRTGNVESHVDTSVKEAIDANVESSNKASDEIEKSEVEKVTEE